MPRLEAADDASWLDAFGFVPQTEEISGDAYVREIRVSTGVAEELHITWDVADDSVRVRHRGNERILVDLFREQATRLTIERDEHGTALVLEYGGPDGAGRARIQVSPEVVIEDNFLRV
ncbi:hypothetical protein J2X46_001400 [Nocardioides sp. BE266]|uniref:hypothetical protein n=1 Tax=Nocardioides sp. BE266 TaxID=2817725 RepID=UPI002859F71A|nr:hypothetical protein [Nocardioides sp. BE266]MDR7252424.1 hypothetical protein [Nocardioides sp. BE266]